MSLGLAAAVGGFAEGIVQGRDLRMREDEHKQRKEQRGLDNARRDNQDRLAEADRTREIGRQNVDDVRKKTVFDQGQEDRPRILAEHADELKMLKIRNDDFIDQIAHAKDERWRDAVFSGIADLGQGLPLADTSKQAIEKRYGIKITDAKLVSNLKGNRALDRVEVYGILLDEDEKTGEVTGKPVKVLSMYVQDAVNARRGTETSAERAAVDIKKGQTVRGQLAEETIAAGPEQIKGLRAMQTQLEVGAGVNIFGKQKKMNDVDQARWYKLDDEISEIRKKISAGRGTMSTIANRPGASLADAGADSPGDAEPAAEEAGTGDLSQYTATGTAKDENGAALTVEQIFAWAKESNPEMTDAAITTELKRLRYIK